MYKTYLNEDGVRTSMPISKIVADAALRTVPLADQDGVLHLEQDTAKTTLVAIFSTDATPVYLGGTGVIPPASTKSGTGNLVSIRYRTKAANVTVSVIQY
jgi:hypothetical protein